MWMGNVSAWLALAMAAMFAVNAYFQYATGVSGTLYVGTALGLAVGAYRTLRKMSGGLRLLAGFWGFAAGILAAPLFVATNVSLGSVGFAAVAIIGLALTVLHKEKK
jgi:hypothetical protein